MAKSIFGRTSDSAKDNNNSDDGGCDVDDVMEQNHGLKTHLKGSHSYKK